MSADEWINSNSSTDALYLRLQSRLEKAIRDGEYLPGAKLPPERLLAERLSLSRTTVTNAYRELEAKGLVRGYVGRGTYVCALPEPSDTPFAWRGKMSTTSLRLSAIHGSAFAREAMDPNLIVFSMGAPAVDLFPLEQYRQIERSISNSRALEAMGMGAVCGQPVLRDAIARMHSVRRSEVLVVAGSQQGLDLLARCLIDPGDNVIVDRPGYFIGFQTFRAAGARLIGWNAAKSDMGELEDLILRYQPKFICTTPTFQNPTARTLSLAQRRELIALATRYRIPLIEDDPFRELYFDAPAPPTLRELDERGIVIHLGTFSKVLAPGLRLGYVIAPANVVELLAHAKERAACFTAGPEQLVVAEIAASGLIASHLERLRREHRLRRDAMIDALRGVFHRSQLTFATPSGGLFLWCRLPANVSGLELNEMAKSEGVVFSPGEYFYPDAPVTREMRLCFSGVPVAKIGQGVEALRRALGRAMASKPQVVATQNGASSNGHLRAVRTGRNGAVEGSLR